jgi:hypothetical protein
MIMRVAKEYYLNYSYFCMSMQTHVHMFDFMCARGRVCVYARARTCACVRACMYVHTCVVRSSRDDRSSKMKMKHKQIKNMQKR